MHSSWQVQRVARVVRQGGVIAYPTEAVWGLGCDPWDELDLKGTLPEVTRRILMEVERRKIQQALDEAQWDHGRAASALQIPPRVLLARIRDFKLAPK